MKNDLWWNLIKNLTPAEFDARLRYEQQCSPRSAILSTARLGLTSPDDSTLSDEEKRWRRRGEPTQFVNDRYLLLRVPTYDRCTPTLSNSYYFIFILVVIFLFLFCDNLLLGTRIKNLSKPLTIDHYLNLLIDAQIQNTTVITFARMC